MQLPPQSPWSPYVHFQGDSRLHWGVLFHHLSYFTSLVPCRGCSVSPFSHGWLIAYTPLLPYLSCKVHAQLELSLSVPAQILLSHRTPLSLPLPPTLTRLAPEKQQVQQGPAEGGPSGGKRGQVIPPFCTIITPLCLQTCRLSSLPHPSPYLLTLILFAVPSILSLYFLHLCQNTSTLILNFCHTPSWN